MFDSLTKSKFYTRCKSLIKMTRTRLEVLKNKKAAVAKYFKNDIADLLKTGLDYNAYGRAEGLLVELNLIARYDFIEQFCGCISSNLSAMNKQKECPEECKEAVQSLIYAAARFAEFPELRDLRYLFAQRYGTCLEMFINKEFVEKLKPNPVTKDMKLQLMHDIAQEFSIQWSSKSLEQKLFQPQPAKQHSFPERESLAGDKSIDDVYKRKKSIYDVVSKRDCQDTHDDDSYKLKNGEEDASTRRCSYDAASETTDIRNVKEHQSSGRKNEIDNKYNLPSSSEDEVSSGHRRDSSARDSLQSSASSVGSVSEDEEDRRRPPSYRMIPPPYLKPKVEKREKKVEIPPKLNIKIAAEETNHPDGSAHDTKPKPRSVRRRPLEPPLDNLNDVVERSPQPPPGREYVDRPLKPPTGRQYVDRPLKPPPGCEMVCSISRKSSLGSQEDNGKARGVFQGDGSNQRGEGEMLDGLLLHYSKKNSPHEMNELEPHLQTHSRDASEGTGETSWIRKTKSEPPVPRGGATLSEEPVTPTRATKDPARAFSMQTDTLNGHVHPKLPDCDELAARIAALRRR